ncbi:MAG: DNA polymerase III subunit delta, partial [Oscillospiraceae bacterium]|nr:DNA polymerase III subunit delta [Oscillospiraceae bacterium]
MLSDLKRHIKDRTPAALYVFHGEETYLRDHYLTRLKELIVPEGTETFNLSRFDDKITPDGLSQAVTAAPFMADRRLVLLWDADIYKADAETKDALIEHIGGLDGVTMVIVYDAAPYKPDARTKLFKAVSNAGVTVEFKQQSAADLLPWIRRRFEALGKQIDDPEYLLFLCGHLMAPLTLEIEKIAAYCNAPDGRVKRRHIDAVGTPTVEAAAFDMTDAICAGQFGKALTLLRRMLDMREEPVMLLGALGKQMRGLYLARLTLDRGQGSQVVMKGMGYRS